MKILGIDYGRVKIGLAVGDTETGLAEPLGVILSTHIKEMPKIAQKEGVEKIVVGVPGGKIEVEIREFGKNLQKQTGLPVEYFDETLTSYEAQKFLIKIQKKRKFRREKEDAFAAAIMLQSYLDGLIKS